MKRQYGFITFTKWFSSVIVWFSIFASIGIILENSNGNSPDNAVIALFISIPFAVLAYFAIKMFLYVLFPKYRKHKEEYKQWKKSIRTEKHAKIQPDSEIIKIQMLGTNQAFDTSFFSGITYNTTEYTVKVFYNNGASAVKKVKGSWLNRYSDLIEK